jgi:urea transport system permease protein
MRWILLLLSALVLAAPVQALTAAQALALAKGDTESRIKALNALVAEPDAKTMALIQALSDDAVRSPTPRSSSSRTARASTPSPGPRWPCPTRPRT